MLDTTTKRRIDTARDILVGKVPDPKSQVEQITIALIFKFMNDMDLEAEELGGIRSFFTGEYEKYSWHKLFDPSLSGFEVLGLYGEALVKLSLNPSLPQLFRDIFKNAYLPYRDPETLKSFIKIINDFSYDHSERLGDAFEYLLSVLGSQGDAGQFRTPRHIIDFMVELIDPKKSDSILDPACGTAGFLISSYKHIWKNNSSNYTPTEDKPVFEVQGAPIEELGALNGKNYNGDKLTPEERSRLIENICGYDISPDMVRLSLVNLYLHGFTEPHIYEYDSLTSDERWSEYYDIIMANPPFMSPKGGIKPHKRFSMESSRSEVLFVDYIAEHLKPTGRAAIIVPEGIIFQGGGAYKQLRKMLVQENYLVGVISLPAGLFNPYSNVKTSILWIDKSLARKTNSVLFVKIVNDGFDLGAQRKPIKLNDLPEAYQIMSTYRQGLEKGEGIDASEQSNLVIVPKDKLAMNGDYNLSGERYIKRKELLTDFPIVTLGSICKNYDSKRVPITQSDRKEGDYPYYGASGIVDHVEDFLFNEDLLLVSEDGANLLARVTPIAFSVKGKIWVNNHAHVLKFDSLFTQKFVELALNSISLEPYITGAAQPKLNQQALNSITLPLPPLSVQQDIVAEIEGYQKIIGGARQVVDNYKPRIDIDPKWEMVELVEVCNNITDGSHFSPETCTDGYPYITVRDLDSGIIDFEECKKIDAVNYNLLVKNGCKPEPNDILFSKDGTVGKCAFIDFTKDFVVLSSLAIIKPNTTKVNPRYLYQLMSTDLFINEAIDNKTGVAIKRIVLKTLKTIKIPLPDFNTQNIIVIRLEEEQQLVAANKRLIELYEQKIKDRIARVWGE